MTPEEKLSDARIYLATHAPYFRDAVLRLIPYPTEEIPTYAVSPNMVMVYNPKYVMSLTDQQNATRLWHEIQHVLRDSFSRLIDVDPDVNNICSDLAINSSGLNGPWDFGPDGILPSTYGMPDGLTMEEYHDLLPQHPQCKQHVQGKGGVGSGKCGGVAGNSPNKDLEEKIGQIGRSKADINAIKRMTARAILDSKQAGKLPGGWKEWAEAMLAPPKVQWATKLQSIYRDSYTKLEAGMDDYSFARLNKRTYMFPDGALLPYMIEYSVEVELVLDTSGSMNIETEIKPSLREARDVIIQSGNESLWFVQVDAQLGCQPKRVRAIDLLRTEINGRGGTNFCPAFEHAPTLKPRPRLLIYFTDGIGPAPKKPPKDMEVIWCLMGKHRQVPAKWGHVVHVEN